MRRIVVVSLRQLMKFDTHISNGVSMLFYGVYVGCFHANKLLKSWKKISYI